MCKLKERFEKANTWMQNRKLKACKLLKNVPLQMLSNAKYLNKYKYHCMLQNFEKEYNLESNNELKNMILIRGAFKALL